jgi:hypothetical protein
LAYSGFQTIEGVGIFEISKTGSKLSSFVVHFLHIGLHES